jgi:hypothetical protein
MPVQINPPVGNPPGATGRWMASLQDGLPGLYAHAGAGTPQDDPITVFWGGTTASDYALNFFTQSLPTASSTASANPFFRTVIFTEDDEKVFIYRDSAQLPPPPYDKSAEFIRLEHLLQVPEGPSFESTDLLPSDYIVWARLTEPSRQSTDSIGVYVKPSRFQNMKPHLATFLSGTMRPLTIEQAAYLIDQVNNNLGQLRS